MKELIFLRRVNWPVVFGTGIIVFGLLGYGYVKAINEKNALEKIKLEQQMILEREKMAQEKEMQQQRVEADKEVAQIKADQQAQAALDAKIEKYRAECKSEKLRMMKTCDTSLNYKCPSQDIKCMPERLCRKSFLSQR